MKTKDLEMANRLWWLFHVTINGTDAERIEAFDRMYSNIEPLNLEWAQPCCG